MSDRQVPGTSDSPHRGELCGMAAGNPPPVPPTDPTEDLTPDQKRLYEAWTGFGLRLIKVEANYLVVHPDAAGGAALVIYAEGADEALYAR